MSDEQFWSIIKSHSSKPFHVNTGKGKIWYYLKHGIDTQVISKVVGKVHNCQTCRRNAKQISGFFGPSGYAVNFGEGDLYNEIEDSRIISRTKCLQPGGFMMVTKDTILKPVRQAPGFDDFFHFSFNMKPDHITEESLYSNISDVLIKNLYNGGMDIRLDEIITNLQKSHRGISDMSMIEETLKDKKLLRKDFWIYRLNYAKKVQKYASRFPNGDNFKEMDPYHKMHVRIFALFYGGSYSYSENLMFKASSHLVDCSKDVFNGGTLINFMNSRSDPENYMVQQVARALEKNSVESRFTISLAWSSTTDLDLWVKTPYGEIVNHANKNTRNCKTILDFDANGHDNDCMENPVENITLDYEQIGIYDVYVNNFKTRNNELNIPFTVIVTIDGEREIFESAWVNDCKKKKKNTGGKLKNMKYVTCVHISEMMARKFKPMEMSTKKMKSFNHLLGSFETAFGNIKTEIVDITTLSDSKHIDVNKDKIISRNMRDLHIPVPRIRTRMCERTGGDFINISDILNSDFIDMRIYAKDFPPSIVTTHNCYNKLKSKFIVNTYYEKGHLPVKPMQDRRLIFSRLDNEWHKSPKINVICISRMNSGYFLTIENPRLPRQDSEWILGAGMYVDDLKSEYHKFREIWKTHHIRNVIKIGKNTTPAIGVFMCFGNSHRICINGVDMIIKSE